MTILIVLGLIVLWGKTAPYDSWREAWGFAAMVMLALAAVTIPVNRLGVRAAIAEVRAVDETARLARAAGDGLEGAAFRGEVAEVNRWIASQKFYNGTVFDIWIPDEVENLEPIR